MLLSLLWLGLTLVVLIILLKLSLWQYERGIEKDQRASRIIALNKESPLTLDEVITLSTKQQFTSKDSINDFPVTITGSFNSSQVFLHDNQVDKHKLGYRVLQVVETDKYAVLVNLGWVLGSIDRSILPDITSLNGSYRFTGHVRIIEQGIMLQAQDFSSITWPLRVQQIELAKFSALLNKPLLPFVVYLDKSSTIGYKKNWHPIVMPADKHFGYAFQWAALAIAWLILMIYLRIKTNKTRNLKV
jgi:surfeit locus 1 family protein